MRAGRCRCIAAFLSAAFTIPFRREFAILNIEMLNAFAAGEMVTPELLAARGMVRHASRAVKILGDGDLHGAL